MAGDTTCLSVVDFDGGLRSDLVLLNVEKARARSVSDLELMVIADILDVMGQDVDAGEAEHGVRDLSVEELGLVQRQELDLGSYESKNVPAHGEEDEDPVQRQDQSGTSRHPNGECEGIQTGEEGVRCL